MKILDMLSSQWQYLLSMLPTGLDLEATARQSGALDRKRVVRSAETLLRLALVYGSCNLSLRQASAWAQAQGVVELSQVALMKRLRSSGPWLGQLLGAKLAERAGCESLEEFQFRVRLVDATTVSAPGSRGTDWRIHLGFNLGDLQVDSVELTGAEGGESLKRFRVEKQELLIGDAGYAHRAGLWAVHQAGGLFLVRLNWQNLPLQTREGQSFDLLAAVRAIPEAQAVEFAVQTAGKAEIGAIPARLVAVRKSAAATEEARQKIRREASKKGRKVDPRTLEAAAYILVLTTIAPEQLRASQVLELYRFRWQIEIAFKRMKSLLDLDALPAKDPALARSWIYAKLLAVLLVEDLRKNFLAFSPWGYRLREPQPRAA
jgi:hypothetical protein